MPEREGSYVGPAVVEAILVVDPVVPNVSRLKVELTVVKRPDEAPVTRLVTVLFSAVQWVLIMTVLLREVSMESVVEGTVQ